MAILSVGVSADEEATIRHRMKVAGETNLSGHLRRVYFEGGSGNEELLGNMKRQIDVLTAAVGQTQRLLDKMVDMRTDDTEVQLLAGLYLLLYQSVDTSVQATVDRYLNFKGVEGFLKGSRKNT